MIGWRVGQSRSFPDLLLRWNSSLLERCTEGTLAGISPAFAFKTLSDTDRDADDESTFSLSIYLADRQLPVAVSCGLPVLDRMIYWLHKARRCSFSYTLATALYGPLDALRQLPPLSPPPYLWNFFSSSMICRLI